MVEQMTFRKLEKLLKEYRTNPSAVSGKGIDHLVDFLLKQEDTDMMELQKVIEGHLLESTDRRKKSKVA